MSNLQSCYLSSSCLCWFNSYLFGRLQRVRYKTDVPEGSVFVPQLYSIYVNDPLDSLSAASCFAYVDDITPVDKGCTMAEASTHLQSLQDIVFKWS